MTRLTRAHNGRHEAPVRIVHLGIGNFTRAHEAWYTENAPDANDWGIAAFTGRSAKVADTLAGSEGLYQLAIRGPEDDLVQVISVLSAVHPSDDVASWRSYFIDPAVVIVSSTITEAGYLRDGEGNLDLDDDSLSADLDALRGEYGPSASSGSVTELTTAPAKFLAGLLARRAADAGAITFLPCDNIPDNGAMLRRIIGQAAEQVDPSLNVWIDENVTFVTTMVDRITPRTTEEDFEEVQKLTGVEDPALVITEPFTEWVLSGSFAQGRPAWDEVGANFVDDVKPFENRKLLLLNGSHSLMAYAASIRGHETVYDAINDAEVLSWVEQWWNDAQPLVDLPSNEISDYRQALLSRYRNGRIRHLLAQIAADGSQKIPIRIVGVIKAHLQNNQVALGASRVIAAWLLHLRGEGAPVSDAQGPSLSELVSGDLAEAAAKLLNHLGINDDRVTEAVVSAAEELTPADDTEES